MTIRIPGPAHLLLAFLLLAAGCNAADFEPGTEPVEPGLVRAFPRLRFDRPVDLQHAGDGSNRIFVVEQAGLIRAFPNQPDAAQATTFLDIRGRVNDEGNEEGLLGLAFHPDYEQNGYFFVNYTAAGPRRSVISRFRVDPQNPDRADPASETVLLEVAQPYSNHNGGQIAFGPDGLLYIALGDGGAGGDPQDNAQSLRTHLGKLLRIDVNGSSNGRPYAVPADNPFVSGADGALPEIYAYGLRNPWRFSFDPANGRLWVADVGQNALEEVDVVEKGKNYGWDPMEGNRCYEPPQNCDRDGLVLPVWQYGRSEGGSITGGYVYQGARVPALRGRYIAADFISGRVWALAYGGSGQASATEIADTDLSISSFGEDQNGEQYMLAFDGHLYYVPAPAAP